MVRSRPIRPGPARLAIRKLPRRAVVGRWEESVSFNRMSDPECAAGPSAIGRSMDCTVKKSNSRGATCALARRSSQPGTRKHRPSRQGANWARLQWPLRGGQQPQRLPSRCHATGYTQRRECRPAWGALCDGRTRVAFSGTSRASGSAGKRTTQSPSCTVTVQPHCPRSALRHGDTHHHRVEGRQT